MCLVRASVTYILLCGDFRVLVAGRKISVRSPSVVDGSLVLWQHQLQLPANERPGRYTRMRRDRGRRHGLPVAGRISGAEDSRSTAIYAPEDKISDVPCFSGVIETPHALPCLFDSATVGNFSLRQGLSKQRT